ncbi:hypothetical protein AMAG_19186 [Allomyces macrogynus ATCC 38327]|uniref:Uncharacterized protein n=1 Tax=Allomyces macrogynus (strain ATCC 38327) TaxID=578462 RepID=A0A0L0SSQ6_ALLM3|nr:hypothetical protein AMAG_19186 [Allomyces macrogynus ATCC 38327]|eukprot:KNE65593.1 hypothetical protein AMAG_19186 [Allomyces macrogynus ATCC 38327]
MGLWNQGAAPPWSYSHHRRCRHRWGERHEQYWRHGGRAAGFWARGGVGIAEEEVMQVEPHEMVTVEAAPMSLKRKTRDHDDDKEEQGGAGGAAPRPVKRVALSPDVEDAEDAAMAKAAN